MFMEIKLVTEILLIIDVTRSSTGSGNAQNPSPVPECVPHLLLDTGGHGEGDAAFQPRWFSAPKTSEV